MAEEKSQIVSRERVRAHGEVYTADREVNAMLDLVKPQSEDDGSTFLEPACGDGNFLVAILRRKLKTVTDKYRRVPTEWEAHALIVLGLLYGIDILADNVLRCRERLFEIWEEAYRGVAHKKTKDDVLKSARFILSRNIVRGNALSMMCVDENGNDTDAFIAFSEWKLLMGTHIQRTDFTMKELVVKSDTERFQSEGPDAPRTREGELFAEAQVARFPKILGKPVIKRYSRIWENEKEEGAC